jgi:uncharacterized protein (DUF427 family)
MSFLNSALEGSMSKSPGHRKSPEHKVQELPMAQRVVVAVGGEKVAESDDVIKVEEDGHRDRYYFPRSDIRMDALERTETTSVCPFKGVAHYFSLEAGGKTLADAAWTYEDPYDEHLALKERVAFYEERAPEIEIRMG